MPGPQGGRPLAWHLGTLCLALLLPVLLLAGGLAWRYAAAERVRLDREVLEAARGAAATVERDLAGLLAAAEVLALSPALAAGDVAAFDALARGARDRLGTEVVVRERGGQQVVNTRLPPGAPLPRSGQLEPDAMAIAAGRGIVSDVFTGTVTGRPLFVVNVPVLRDGQAVLFVNLSLPTGRLRDLLAAPDLPPGWVAAVADRRGTYLARTRRHDEFTGQPMRADAWSQLGGPDGVVPRNLASAEDVPIIAAHARVPIAGWTVVVAAPVELARAPLRGSLALTAALGLGLLASAGLLGTRLVRRLNRAFAALTGAAATLGRGEAVPAPVTAVAEVNAAGAALAAAAGARLAHEAALAESEGRLRLALEVAGIGAWTWRAPDRMDWDAQAGAIMGWPEGEQPTTLDSVRRLFHPDDLPAMDAALHRVLAEGVAYDAEFRVRRRTDGAWRWVRSVARSELDAAGAVAAMRGVLMDVHGRRAAEAERAERAETLRLAMRGGRMGAWTQDLTIDAVAWSPELEELFGLPPGGFGGTREAFRALVHPDDLPAMTHAVAAAVHGRHDYAFAFRFRHAAGAWRWMEGRGRAAYDAAGRPVRLHGIGMDITERRAAAEALAASEARRRLAQEAARVGTWDLDVTTGALEWSEESHRLHGTGPAAPATLETWRAALHPEDREAAAAAVEAAPAAGDALEMDYRVLLPGGDVRWIAARGRVLRNAAGRAVRMLGVHLDITERREAEARQALLLREVDHRAKNALAVVQSVVRLTRAEDPRGFAEAVEGRVAALARAHTLLARERWAGGELRRLAEEELAAHLAAGRAVLEGPPLALGANAVQPVSMVLHELATNAAKYGALSVPDGQVAARWTVEGGQVLLSWTETGGPPVTQPPARRGFGTTLIEATVRGQLGGRVERHWEASGLRVVLSLSAERVLRAGTEAVAERSAPAVPTGAADRAALAGARVLVAEDEPLVAMELEETLRGLGCAVVGPAATLEEATRLARAGGLDAAVLDVNLRGQPAFPAADLLLAAGVPVVFATGYGDLPPGRDGGHTALLRKPVARAELAAALARLLHAAPAPGQPATA